MIIDTIILIAAGILITIRSIFSFLTFPIPSEFTAVIVESFDWLKYIHGIINVPSLVGAATIFLIFIALYYGWHLVRWAYAHLPWIGKHKDHKIN